MRFRKLRIAWSVGCVIACVLLIVFWVRSYWWADTASNLLGHYLFSLHGNVVIDDAIGFEFADGKAVYFGAGPIGPFFTMSFPLANVAALREGSGVAVPYWTLILPFAVLAATAWLRQLPRRFTVRTLLITTTLVAVVLGLAVYASR
jgi:hypothetical protein